MVPNYWQQYWLPVGNRFHPIEVFFIQLGMESNDSGNRCFYLPVLLHVEQTAKLKQEIFFVGREWNTVVFPANADGFQRWFFGEEGVIGTIFICTISFCILSFCMKNVFCHTCICCICFFARCGSVDCESIDCGLKDASIACTL